MKKTTYNYLKILGKLAFYSIILFQLWWMSDNILYSHIAGNYKVNKNPAFDGKLTLYTDQTWKCFGPKIYEESEGGSRTTISYTEGTWSNKFFSDTIELMDPINNEGYSWIFLMNQDSLIFQKTVLY